MRNRRSAPSSQPPPSSSAASARATSTAARLTNTGKTPVHVKEVSLFRIAHDLPDATALYGESFQMLTQTAGTLGKPIDLAYDELKHYKIPQPADAKVVTGMMTLTPPGGETMLLAFTSCRRFNGRFFLRPKSIEVVLDTEGPRARSGRIVGPRRVHFHQRPQSRRAARQARRPHRPEPSAAALQGAARRLVQLVLLRPARHRART